MAVEFDTTGVIPAETILLPEGYVSVFRLFLLAFDITFGAIGIDVAEELLGVTRVENASDGQFALLLSGNSLLPLSDAATVFTCDGTLPENLVIDIAHLGNRPDTLNVIMTIGEQTSLPQTQAELDNAAGFVFSSLIADQEVPYQEFVFPLEANMNGIAADSAFLWLINSSDTMQIADGTQAGFLIDNIRVMSEPSSTNTPELASAVKVFPMPFRDNFYMENDNSTLDAKIYNTSGQLIKTFRVEPGVNEYEMNELLQSGNYILELNAIEQNERSVYNIIKG